MVLNPNIMTRILLIPALAIVLLSISISASAISIQDAITQKKISCIINSTGEHSGKCLLFSLTNLTNQEQSIQIDNGLYLQISDSNLQNHVVTEDVMVTLAPKKKIIQTINGCCVQQNNGGPQKEKSTFSIVPSRLSPVEKRIVALVAQAANQGQAEQQAIWCAKNKENPNEFIYSGDSATVTKYVRALCKEMGIPVGHYINTYKKPAVIVENTMEFYLRGTQTLRNMKKNDVITYFVKEDSSNTIIQKNEILCPEPIGTITKDKYKLAFDIHANNLNPTKAYYFIIKVNGVVREQWRYEGLHG
jgi:hypothetical protein